MNNFEYLAFDPSNNFSVVKRRFETLEAAQQYRADNIHRHSNATIRFVREDISGLVSGNPQSPNQPNAC